MSEQQILSHLPGIFYRKPSPDASSYKEVGDRVEPGDVIGLVEVMKSFHEIQSDISGTVRKFLLENEDPVMAGQPVVTIDS